jgi:hypothetical protein
MTLTSADGIATITIDDGKVDACRHRGTRQ